MPYLMGRTTVEDYATFRKAFDGAEDVRKAAGALSSCVFQSVDDPNEVIVEIEFSTADAAKAYRSTPRLLMVAERALHHQPGNRRASIHRANLSRCP